MKTRILLALALSLVLVAGTAIEAAAITRTDIIARAKRWVDLEVAYNQGSYFESYRQDCSGMMSMAWRLDRSYSSRTLEPSGIKISRDELQPGDMLLKYDYHAAVFYKWANSDHTWYWALEQSGSVGHAVERLTLYPYWNHDGFSAYVHRQIEEVDDYEPYIEEVAARDRYGPAVVASRLAFESDSATSAVLCSGETWPDALGGSALAGVLQGPVLLTASDSLPANVAGEIERLGVSDVVIVGGEGAVSSSVASSVADLGVAVRRIGGADRYETAAMVASQTVIAASGEGTPTVDAIYIATGSNFADALGAAPAAAFTGRPILLSRPSAVPSITAQTIRSLETSRAYIAGGEGALGLEIEEALYEMGLTEIERFAGVNRYETSRLLAEHGVEEGLVWDNIALATGTGFADALAGGVMQARRGSPLVLTPGDKLAPAPDWAVREHLDVVEKVTVLGGEGAVQPIVRRQIRWIIDEP